MTSIVGQYIGLWMRDEALNVMLGRVDRAPQANAWWAVFGRVEAETPALGLWVRIDSIKEVAGEEETLDAKQEIGATLICWPTIAGAVIWPEKPKVRTVGFRT